VVSLRDGILIIRHGFTQIYTVSVSLVFRHTDGGRDGGQAWLACVNAWMSGWVDEFVVSSLSKCYDVRFCYGDVHKKYYP